MARSAAHVSRDWYGGPSAFWWMAVRVLLVIGLLRFAALAFAGSHFFFGPWLLMPLLFFWLFALPLGWGYRRRFERPDGWPERDDLPDRRPAAQREQELESELTRAHRQIRELESKVSWQERLLQTPATSATPAVPATPAPPAPGHEATEPQG